jgi:uncharacterized protein (DUF433 family)
LSAKTSYPHLTVDEGGVAYLGDSRYKVLHLAREHYHYGWSAEELMRQHPDLRPEEIYSALTYFYDHLDELSARMATEFSPEGKAPHASSLSRAELLKRRTAQGA